ncbi:gluconate 2-dehydrogenase subunit 3 family protein [Flagellimonas iocasae]|uniref:Gluconate 2-dehydrogenase subunit 3 family protein n=1 Tax=Flagellimonas iocasae TaxID=2055905 RepID=A0ABW4Y5P6_9FLAO
MERRDTLKLKATILGGSIIGSQFFLSGCDAPHKKRSEMVTNDNVRFLDEIGETILPDTEESPGAKVAYIRAFMKIIVNDCYSKDDASIFVDGIGKVEEKSIDELGESFLSLSKEKKLRILTQFDEGIKKSHIFGEAPFPYHAQRTYLLGYFISEGGATEALRYNSVPDRFEGYILYNGKSAWIS